MTDISEMGDQELLQRERLQKELHSTVESRLGKCFEADIFTSITSHSNFTIHEDVWDGEIIPKIVQYIKDQILEYEDEIIQNMIWFENND